MTRVYLVGAGPGDPELITMKALRVLKAADVVIYDRLVSPEVLALGNPGATYVFAGKALGQQDAVQREIFGWLLHYGALGRTIVRLKGGDPMVFGRGGEELEFLAQHGFDVEVIPGVSSALAAPALSGIPLTYRGVAASFAVVAGHRESRDTFDWAAYRGVDTLVVLMGVAQRAVVAQDLIRAGRERNLPVAFVERVSTGRERVVESTLAAVADGQAEVESPAVWIIGEVVRLRVRMAERELSEVAA
ncbi:MAG: uroporphyrinogen-III C-methyltransferase [Bryobacteraceae bacterium]|nr:uroporphyrinogen-III C-methyltransferase [Bryobacteraceae bacterium]